MKNISALLFGVSLIFGSASVLANEINPETNHMTAEQLHKQYICQDDKCPTEAEKQIGVKGDIKGQDTSTAQQDHAADLCNSDKCLEQQDKDIGKNIQGHDESTAKQAHDVKNCLDGKCPNKSVTNDLGYE